MLDFIAIAEYCGDVQAIVGNLEIGLAQVIYFVSRYVCVCAFVLGFLSDLLEDVQVIC